MQNKVWKTDGFGDRIRFTDEDKFAARIEFKPIPGLNVGAQFFFVDPGYNPIVSSLATRSLGDTGAWKEIGLGASYSNRQYDISGGIRFDSDVDIMNRDDSKTYLTAYYGDWSMLGSDGAPFLGPKYKHKAEVIQSVTYDTTDPANPKAVYGDAPFYDGGHYAFLGFQWKRTKPREIAGDIHGGIYNLGAFDKFGYARVAERVTWYQLLPKFDVGLIMQQEFYGGDVFDTVGAPPSPTNPTGTPAMVNAPFLQFAPSLAYNFAYLPGTNNSLLQVSVTPFFGICPDVLDMYFYNRVSVDVGMGIWSLKLFYDITYEKYVDVIEKGVPGQAIPGYGTVGGTPGIKPATKHVVGLAFNIMF
jgi:hypothetical protein